MKTCRQCGAEKPLADFPGHNSTRDRKRHECRACCAEYQRAYRARSADRLRRYEQGRYSEDRKLAVRLRKYGITQKEYERMEQEQGGLCFICQKPCSSGRRLAVDHDHETGHVRTLLCMKCNTAEGALNGDPELGMRLVNYMRGWIEFRAQALP